MKNKIRRQIAQKKIARARAAKMKGGIKAMKSMASDKIATNLTMFSPHISS